MGNVTTCTTCEFSAGSTMEREPDLYGMVDVRNQSVEMPLPSPPCCMFLCPNPCHGVET
jgi:hypothetical protein